MTQATGIIDPSAKIGPDVKLGKNVTIRENVIIEGNVTVGDDCIFEPFCVVRGPTTIGKGNHFYQFCSIGEGCQDLKYAGEPTTLTTTLFVSIAQCTEVLFRAEELQL